jgi:hypothetical protein
MRVATLGCVVLLLVLTYACGGSGTAPSPSQPSNVFGSWTAVAGSSFTRANIQSQGNLLVTHLWAVCVPECDWGTSSVPLTTLANNSYALPWTQDFVLRTQQIDLESDGRLKIQTHSHYVDNSGRPDIDFVDFFRQP